MIKVAAGLIPRNSAVSPPMTMEEKDRTKKDGSSAGWFRTTTPMGSVVAPARSSTDTARLIR